MAICGKVKRSVMMTLLQSQDCVQGLQYAMSKQFMLVEVCIKENKIHIKCNCCGICLNSVVKFDVKCSCISLSLFITGGCHRK